jgi:hypothetical protein
VLHDVDAELRAVLCPQEQALAGLDVDVQAIVSADGVGDHRHGFRAGQPAAFGCFVR